jgi:hypothetical protein
MTYLLLMLILIFPLSATGATYWVDINSGNDSNSCSAATNSATPRQHISNGVSCMSGGDTVIVRDGTYVEGVEQLVPSGLDSSHHSILKAEHRGGATIQPGSTQGPGNHVVVKFQSNSFITLDGFIIDMINSNQGGQFLNIGVAIYGGCDHITVQYNEIRNLPAIDFGISGGAGVNVEDGVDSVLVSHNHIHHIAYGFNDNHVHGIYVSGTNGIYEFNEIDHFQALGVQQFTTVSNASGNIYRGNIIHHSTGGLGLYISSGDNAQLYNNILHSMPGRGIRVQDHNNIQIYFNSITQNNSGCIELDSGSGHNVRNNICWNNPGGDGIDNFGADSVTQDHNLLGVDPHWVNPGAFDLHLTSSSTNVIDQGVCISGINVDADGVTRQQGSTCDLGAYEFGGGAPIAWWKFDENSGTIANDSTGNNHSINLNSGAGWGTPKVGISSLRCNGSTVGPSTTDIIFNNPLYTWMAWIKGDANPSNTIFNSPLANGPTNVGTDSWGLWWSSQDPSSETVQSIFHRDSGGIHQLKIPSTLVANLWYHIAVTFNGSTVQLYLNGTPQTSFAAGTPVAPSGPPQVCGRYFPTPWAGNIDEFNIDNRAWSASEIATAYNAGAATMNRRRAVTQ